MPPSIDIIKFPFSGSGFINRSAHGPDAVQTITENLLSDEVGGWKSLDLDANIPPSTDKKTGLKNLEAAKDAITKQGHEIIRSLWQEHTPLSLGGEHTQGIATIKATALTLLAKAIVNNDLAINSQLNTAELSAFAAQGDAENMAAFIRTAIEDGHVQQDNIDKFINNIAVIWVDAHADYNDVDSSGSGSINGVPLACATGRDVGGLENLFGGDFIQIKPQNCYVLCTRDIDNGERKNLDEDGINYQEWELTTPGAMRTPDDPDNPKTLKTAIDDVFSRIGNDKQVIFSLDIDGLHAGVHESKYGPESIAATGTPMGLKLEGLQHAFGKQADPDLIRRNTQNNSPAGPSVGDAYEAIQGMLQRPNVVAADLSEICLTAGPAGAPFAEENSGLTLKTSMRLLAAMTGANLDDFSKKLEARQEQIDNLVQGAIAQEKKESKLTNSPL